ncbi:CoA transferase [Pararobbsia alpina]|uniref:Formyl-CoA:oxalate CoA-transferase n=1 Tax=Pararobbsia alpina TaxID=621374 RepID=A0A6S7CKQ8_9BURK|nr:CoA transferase [Pararobbsia alpina]CAB3792155.1 Formyl-CoA:oxalate CoA-transferase [Pararobbsia alpina]
MSEPFTASLASSPSTQSGTAARFLHEIWGALGGDAQALHRAAFTASGNLPSAFAATDLAAASIGSACLALAELVRAANGTSPRVKIDRRLASFWFATSLRPQGWQPAPLWDAVAGDYRTADGWIRLHTNAPHHRDAALAVLDVPVDRAQVAQAVARWNATALETAVVGNGGCAAAMRTIDEWAVHPQGRAVAAEPLFHIAAPFAAAAPRWRVASERPLRGLRVLDLTRVLAGPTATRFLAGFGAEVLRIDPPTWDEPAVVPEVVLGKRCARLDLKNAADRERFEQLLSDADVLVHGYRSDALTSLGLGEDRRRELNPGLVDISLDAYGWSGPWTTRRGFDSLVQMSTGIADAGMRAAARDKPTPLPVQALDHATGYMMAAAAIRGLLHRFTTGEGYGARMSLARTARLLVDGAGGSPDDTGALAVETADDLADTIESTFWGPAQRVKPPAFVDGAPMHWDIAAAPLGTSPAAW